jgi:outer membrane protein TolC
MTRGFLVLTLILSASIASAQSSTEKLSLGDAVAFAIQNNRSLQNADLEAAKAQKDVDTARTRRYPQFKLDALAAQLLRPVDIHFDQGVFGTIPPVGPIPATDTTITTEPRPTMVINGQVSQPLSQLFRINLNVQTTEAARNIERERVRAGRLDVIKNVKELYYTILKTESALGAADEAVSLLREVNRIVDERLLRQVVLKSDAMDVRSRLAQAEHNSLTLRNALASQKQQLNQLIGRDVRTSFETAGAPQPTMGELDLEAARSQALADRPEIRQARLQLEQAELAHRIAKADSIPDVSLAFTYLSPLNIEGAPRNIATLGVQLEWEPFDWGRRGKAVATRDLEVRQARNALRDAEDRAVLEIDAAFRTIEEARSLLRVASLAQEAARETARVRSTQFQAQAALLSDVLDADAAMANANNDYQQALLALWQAGADYEHVLGQEVTQ